MIEKDAPEIADAASSETMVERSIEASKDGQDDPQIIGQDAFPSPAPVFPPIFVTSAVWQFFCPTASALIGFEILAGLPILRALILAA